MSTRETLRGFQARINNVNTDIRNEYDLSLIGDLFRALKEALAAHPVSAEEGLREALMRQKNIFAENAHASYSGAQVAEVMRAILDRAALASASGDGWVSVKERLPERHIGVGVWTTLKYQYAAFYDITGWWLHGVSGRPLGEVTHWRPLLAPPASSAPEEEKT